MAQISDFIDQSTGTFASTAKSQAALITGQYGGLTPVDADGNAVPADSPLSPELLMRRQQLLANVNGLSGGMNWIVLAAIAFGVWYFFLRKK